MHQADSLRRMVTKTWVSPAPVLAALCVLLSGCGAETYERRLEETRKYFAYLQNVNEALTQGAWSESGIEFRVPKQFQVMDPPRKEEAEGETPGEETPESGPGFRPGFNRGPRFGTSESSSTPPDPRQPAYLGVELPGLLGAWQATFSVDSDDGASDRTGYLYVCGNHYLWLQKEDDPDVEPLKFFREFGTRLARVFGVSPPTVDYDWDWKREKLPPGQGYVASKAYESIIFEIQINGLTYDLMLFRHEARDIHVMIMYVVPQGVDPRLRLKNAIDYSLEYLEVSDRIPTKRPPASNRPKSPGF